MKTKNHHLTSKGAVFAASFLTFIAAAIFAVGPALAAVDVAASLTNKDRGVDAKSEPGAGKSGEVAPAQVALPATPDLITAGTYIFSNSAGVALEDMSSGTTQLVPAASDDGNSVAVNIGFDFWFDGVRFTQFGANANGFIRFGVAPTGTSFTNSLATTTNAPKVAAYWDDLWVGTNGQVHYKTIGSAPNRKLIVEWQNMTIPRAGAATTGAGTFQLWAFETTGIVQFVYGPGIIVNSANGGYSIGLQSGATTNFASVTTSTNTVSYATANNAQTDAIAPGVSYLFTPNIPAAPTGFSATAVTATSMTINWTDNATNEVGYVIYQSNDGTNFTFVAQVAAGTMSQALTGLTPSTTYTFRIQAVTEGGLSSALVGAQATSAAGNITSAGTGLWDAPATWVGGVVPTVNDNVTIAAGHTVTINSSNAFSVTVQSGGVLEFEATTARTLTVGSSVTINSGGTFQTAATGTQTGHILSVGTNLINNGTLDFSTNANTAGANITFTGASNNTFSGTGATTDVRTITVNKGTSNANTIELLPTNFTVQGVATDVAGFLTSRPWPARRGW